MNKKPSNKEFKRVFDSIAKNYDRVSNRYVVKRRIEFITRLAKGRCLEVGAGSGEISNALSKSHKTVATDISGEMIREIKRKNRKITTRVCDAEKLPFTDKTFDTLVSAEMVYYLDRPEKFIKEAYRVLRENGTLIMTSANYTTLLYDKIRNLLRSVGFKSMYFDDKNDKFMSLSEMQKLLQDGGFKVKKTEKVIIFPFANFDNINRLLEKTFIKHIGSFIFIEASK